jgi:SAM-dependent methyltransferase
LRVADPEFRTDLYIGTAADYDRFRPPYPQALIDDLAARSGATGSGWLLDLACGTGQIAFAMRGKFAEIWAVDQEPDMVAVVREKALADGAAEIYTEVAAAEQLSAPAAAFDLVAVGNAFHRMARDTVAAKVATWLRPGGCLALLWGGSPWDGDAPWQQELVSFMNSWRRRAQAATGGAARVPAGHEQARAARPDAAVLRDAGFEMAGAWQFPVEHDWTADTIVGYMFSTAVLSRRALGDLAPRFEADLRAELTPYAGADGLLRQTISFACDLARRPAG